MQALYRDLDATWERRAASLNRRLAERGLPVRSPISRRSGRSATRRSSRYNWMFQYYLRAEGLALSWIGTGRLIFSLNFSDADFEAVAERFLAAAEAMQRDGWWETGALATDRAIKRRILREMLAHAAPARDAGELSAKRRSWSEPHAHDPSGFGPPRCGSGAQRRLCSDAASTTGTGLPRRSRRSSSEMIGSATRLRCALSGPSAAPAARGGRA